MKANRVKEIVSEELRRQRKRLLSEQGMVPEPNPDQSAHPRNPTAQSQPQPQSQQQPAPEPSNSAPALNPKKSQGIIIGALKTLINSGAITGVDQSQVSQIASDLMTQLNAKLPTYKTGGAPEADAEDPEFEDDLNYSKEDEELEDQNQYDPDLDKQVSDNDENPEEPAPEEDEPLFEAKDFAHYLK